MLCCSIGLAVSEVKQKERKEGKRKDDGETVLALLVDCWRLFTQINLFYYNKLYLFFLKVVVVLVIIMWMTNNNLVLVLHILHPI
jgi:hypothetical protein